jgi:outer membrane protein assembly factor BamB
MASLGRRGALLLPVVLGGCGLWDRWFGENKTPMPGTRIAIATQSHGLEVDDKGARVVLPPPVGNADWPQAGGNPSHAMGHLQVGDTLQTAWRADIGEGGGYRRKITAQPVVNGGQVFTMDSDATLTAYNVANGARLWRLDTQVKGDRSSNVGGGIGVDGDVLYAGTGRAELLALEAGSGKIRWRKPVSTPVRSAPTIADGRVFVITLDNQLQAFAVDDGRRLWGFQATTPDTSVLGLPAPAYADGLVVGGFGSGDLVALRAATGSVAWSDNLGAARGRTSLTDLSSIHGLPVVADGRVYAGSLGGLVVSLDLRTGRRLWERDVASAATPWLAGDWLFLLDTNGQVAAITRAEGRVAWVSQLQQFEDEKKKEDPIYWKGPVLAGDRLILGSSNAMAVAMSPYTGDILGQQKLPGAMSVEPCVAGGTVYVITDEANLIALR